MKKTPKILAVAVTAVSLAGATGAALAGKDKEKCYGVVKAGKNDCATKTSSCAGTSKRDGQSDAFIALPKGVCEKLVNGSLKSS